MMDGWREGYIKKKTKTKRRTNMESVSSFSKSAK